MAFQAGITRTRHDDEHNDVSDRELVKVARSDPWSNLAIIASSFCTTCLPFSLRFSPGSHPRTRAEFIGPAKRLRLASVYKL